MDKARIILLNAIIFLPWIGVLLYYLTKNKRARKYYRKLQEKYTFNTEEESKNKSVITGAYKNRPVKIESGTLNGQKKVNTLLTVQCENPDNFEFKLIKRNKANNSVYSKGDYMLEDNEFDDIFIIQTNNPEKLKRLFDFNTRFKLQQIIGLGFAGEISLHGNSFIYTEQGLVKNDTELMKLELVLHELCDLADVMKYN